MEVSSGTVWNDCLEVIRENVGEENFNTWFKPISPLRVDGDVLTIQVPSQFFYEWLEDNYVPVLKRAIHTVLGPIGPSRIFRGGRQRQSSGTCSFCELSRKWSRKSEKCHGRYL